MLMLVVFEVFSLVVWFEATRHWSDRETRTHSTWNLLAIIWLFGSRLIRIVKRKYRDIGIPEFKIELLSYRVLNEPERPVEGLVEVYYKTVQLIINHRRCVCRQITGTLFQFKKLFHSTKIKDLTADLPSDKFSNIIMMKITNISHESKHMPCVQLRYASEALISFSWRGQRDKHEISERVLWPRSNVYLAFEEAVAIDL